LLPDSGQLQEEEASYANRHAISKHSPALPLHTEEDARHCLEYFDSAGGAGIGETGEAVVATFLCKTWKSRRFLICIIHFLDLRQYHVYSPLALPADINQVIFLRPTISVI
jgi:hypothetical protein